MEQSLHHTQMAPAPLAHQVAAAPERSVVSFFKHAPRIGAYTYARFRLKTEDKLTDLQHSDTLYRKRSPP